MSRAANLASQLRDAGPRLTMRVLEEMYVNAFWRERFGERGRQHADRDGGAHIRYLVEALESGQDRVFVEYATWLRGVLVSRGMCSRHLAENFDRLAQAIDQEDWADRERASDILRAGAHALLHTAGDAGALDAIRGSLAREVEALWSARHPDWLPDERTARASELDDHVSYLADALAFASPAYFVDYVGFMRTFLGRRGIPVKHLRETLVTLSDVIQSRLPALTETPSRFIEAGRAALDVKAIE